jgi:HEAT repeat protein
MQRIVFCTLVIGASLYCPGVAPAQEPLPPVEKWQIEGILAALEDGNPEVRKIGVEKLARSLQTDGRRDLAGRFRRKLVLLLGDKAPSVRLWAAEALGLDKQTTPEVIEKLAALLADEVPDVQAKCAQALGRLSKESPGSVTHVAETVVPSLIKLLRNKNLVVKQSARAALVPLSNQAGPILLKLLQDNEPDEFVRVSAAESLGHVGGEARSEFRENAVLELVRLIDNLPNSISLSDPPSPQQTVVQALGRIGGSGVERFVELLKPQNGKGASRPEARRVLAVDALVRLHEELAPKLVDAALPKLIECLDDPFPMVREKAAEVLGRRCKASTPALLNKAMPKIAALLHDPEERVRLSAMTALARLGEAGMPAFSELLKRDDSIAFAALDVLDRLGTEVDPKRTEVDQKLFEQAEPFLNHREDKFKAKAASVLGRLGVRAKPKLLKLLDSNDRYVKQQTIWILQRMGSKAAPELVELLTNPDRDLQELAASALVSLAYKTETEFIESAVPTLIRLVRDTKTPDSVKNSAAVVLGHLGLQASAERRQEVAQELVNLLKVSDEKSKVQVAEALGRLSRHLPPGFLKTETVLEFIEILKGPYTLQSLTVVEALGRLDTEADAELIKIAVPVLVKLHTGFAGFPSVRDKAAEALFGLLAAKRESVLIRIVEVPYDESRTLPDARWLLHYIGGGGEDVKILCSYLARPQTNSATVNSREEARKALKTLTTAWKSESLWLKEDVAKWWSLIITEQFKDWSPKDADEVLKPIRDRLADADNQTGRGYLPGIERVLRPFEILPPIWVRTLLAFAGINLFAVLLFIFRPGRRSLENWLPILGLSGASVASWLANVPAELYINSWLLGGLLGGELLVLIGAGLLSTSVLRQVAQIEPLNRVAVPLALRLPRSRKRVFRNYVASLRNQLERDKDQANQERYLALPADLKTHADRVAVTVSTDPAAAILPFLSNGEEQRGHVLIEAPGGRGKSALLREVVRQALDRFDQFPASASLPVLLTGTGESVEMMARSVLENVLLGPEFFARHLQAGDFFLVLDGISESGLSDKSLLQFVQGPYGSSTPLLVSTRPTRTFRHVIEGTARWLVVETRRLDESSLGLFVKHYGGTELARPVKDACRGLDGTYLPILVRMSMTIKQTGEGGLSVADLYRSYFLKLFEAQFPNEKNRIAQLDETSCWCLETYWRDGQRRRRYEATDLQQRLLRAGVLIAADNLDPPKEVQYFHDSMQSYLTAYGLFAQDGQSYAKLLRPVDDPTEKPWNRERVLLWAAANEKFVPAQADLLQTGGTELLQMCLATFTPQDALRQWLHDELVIWAETYEEDLRRRDVVNAIPVSVRQQVEKIRGVAKLLMKAAEVCLSSDEERKSVELLGRLYGGIATLIYEIREMGEIPPDTSAA